jgi:hypothetical protein
MGIQAVVTVSICLFTGGAMASSILHVEGSGAQSSRSVMVAPQNIPARSIEVIGADGITQVSRSVVVIGEPSGVSNERVAAINNGSAPSVMRGGVFGEALPAPVAEPEPVKKLSRPALRKKERDERRAIREAIRFGEPLPKKAETQAPTNQESGS